MRSGIDVGEIMNTRLAIATPDMNIADVAKLANKYRIGGLPVVNDKNILVGIITERDVMRKVVAKGKKPDKVKVKEVMTLNKELITATPNEDMNSVAKKMSKYDITRIPIVTEDRKLVGIVTNRDMLDNCPKLIDLLMEQARLKNNDDLEPIAIGVCDQCGNKGALSYKDGDFVCEDCLSKLE